MKLVSACLFSILLISIGLSQSFNGSLLGTVQDSSGATVPNATITAINTETNARIEGRSASGGKYVVSPLLAGRYRLEANAPGFKRFIQGGIVLQVQQQARLDITLAVGAGSEAVPVTADSAMLETSTATIGKVVSNKAILELPLNSRNVYSLIFLTPGVAGSIGNNYNSMSYSVNGARTSMMDTLIDGASAAHPTVQGSSGIS